MFWCHELTTLNQDTFYAKCFCTDSTMHCAMFVKVCRCPVIKSRDRDRRATLPPKVKKSVTNWRGHGVRFRFLFTIHISKQETFEKHKYPSFAYDSFFLYILYVCIIMSIACAFIYLLISNKRFFDMVLISVSLQLRLLVDMNIDFI